MSSLERPESAEWYALFEGRVEWDRVKQFGATLRDANMDTVLWAELRDLMERAAREGLPQGKGPDGKGFKWPMERCRDDLGHLKMDVGNDQHRIYFTAPSEQGFESFLLALLYGLKLADDPDWKTVQNGHIDAAHSYYQERRNDRAAHRLGL